jgi:hypothetical protein
MQTCGSQTCQSTERHLQQIYNYLRRRKEYKALCFEKPVEVRVGCERVRGKTTGNGGGYMNMHLVDRGRYGGRREIEIAFESLISWIDRFGKEEWEDVVVVGI